MNLSFYRVYAVATGGVAQPVGRYAFTVTPANGTYVVLHANGGNIIQGIVTRTEVHATEIKGGISFVTEDENGLETIPCLYIDTGVQDEV